MSGNKNKEAGASSLGYDKSQKTLNEICDTFHSKLNEKFPSISAAFRFYDVNCDS
jgi:hypothetical protein